MTADLRALAAKLRLLKECEVCIGRGWMGRWHDGLDAFDSCTCPVCVAGQRLPTLDEVLAALPKGWMLYDEQRPGETFEWPIFAESDDGKTTPASATPFEAALRLLEAIRGE